VGEISCLLTATDEEKAFAQQILQKYNKVKVMADFDPNAYLASKGVPAVGLMLNFFSCFSA
jgi:hypothetical protein